LKPTAAVLAEAGNVLLAAGQYELARGLLQQAAAIDPRAGGLQFELAIATFHATGASAGLDLMDRLPESERGGDYYMARARMLDASGKPHEADSALEQALQSTPQRPDMYRQAVALLAKQGKGPEALRWIEEGALILPDDREILLLKATTLEFAHHADDAANLLDEIQHRWPEWSAVWLAHGMVLSAHGHYEDARAALETAVALGANNPEAYFFLADCTLRSSEGRKDVAETTIQQALKRAPGDPWIAALAGRIALERGENQLAVDRERAAIRQRPRLIEAHNILSRAYTALGRKPEAEAEREQIRAIQKASPVSTGADDEPPYLRRLFQGSLTEGTAATIGSLANSKR
jgi:tetratricopeptide (TPR) repeat protein